MDESGFHWLVGILEGEATFLAATPSAPRSPIVQLVMTDRDIVERVGSIFVRSVIPQRPRRPNYKVPYATVIKGAHAILLMRAIARHMGPMRAMQIRRAIASAGGASFRTTSHAAPNLPEIDPRHCGYDCDIAWLAGLLEGEGSFSITRDGTLAYPVVSLHMSDEAVVRRAARIMGSSSVWSRPPRDQRWRTTYVTSVSGKTGSTWMRRLRPLMGARRREAIDRALSAYRPINLLTPPDACVVAGCAAPHRARGLCHAHYMSWSRDIVRGRMPRVTPLR